MCLCDFKTGHVWIKSDEIQTILNPLAIINTFKFPWSAGAIFNSFNETEKILNSITSLKTHENKHTNNSSSFRAFVLNFEMIFLTSIFSSTFY
ncbi:hypothetical protein L2E82_25255 [Cichorium intybus]|uniref:Uncharacterized protein n=1 Tax=Cichorium intybus TaxID=13427 RepID=A0ACB9E2Q0_CICIN|nr:hypothetical protein L2E82_25255 [Cichorium intybus]